MKKIIVYSIPECPYCVELKNRLKSKGYGFINVDVSLEENEEEFEQVMKKTGKDEVPVVLYDNNLLAPGISFDTLDELMSIIEDLRSE